MAGPTISRRLTLNSRCRTDSGTFVSEWMSRTPAVAAATRPAARLWKMMPITGCCREAAQACGSADHQGDPEHGLVSVGQVALALH